MKPVGVVRFPGTNCDRDTWAAVEACGMKAQWLWHEDRFEASDVGAVILAGGFSYGDYLRTGALACLSPVMDSVRDAAKRGTPVLGICNGFQILCEAKLLPGALLRNQGLRFVDEWTPLKRQNDSKYWKTADSLELPIAHGEGRFYSDSETLKALEDRGQIWLRYQRNPNGSLADIAGVMNENKNVAGLMPHPERAMASWMGSDAGMRLFENLAGILS